MRRPQHDSSAGAFTALLLTLLLTACGVQPSGVIRGASPPSGAAERDDMIVLFLVQDGKLELVHRPSSPLPPGELLALLATGPTRDESARGLSSDVPPDAAPFTVFTDPGGRTVVDTALPPEVLSTTALDQIVCTLAVPRERIIVLGHGRARACPTHT